MKVNIKCYSRHYDITKMFDEYIYKKYKRYPQRALRKMNRIEILVYNVVEFIQKKVVNPFNHYMDSRERVSVRIDDWDTFSLDYTLAHIILPALKKFKDKDQGRFSVDDEDVPDEIKSTSSKPFDPYVGEIDEFYEARSEYILDAMIYSFEHIIDDSWKNTFYTYTDDTRPEFNFIAIDYAGNEVDEDEYDGEIMYRMDSKNNMIIDRDGIESVEEKIDFGLRMFGKYYRGLWL